MYTLIKRSISFSDNGIVGYKPEFPTWAIIVSALFCSLVLLLMIGTCVSRFSSSRGSGYSGSGGVSQTKSRLAHYNPGATYTDWGMIQYQGSNNFIDNGGLIPHHHCFHSSAHHEGFSGHSFSAPPAYNSGSGCGCHSVAANPTM